MWYWHVCRYAVTFSIAYFVCSIGMLCSHQAGVRQNGSVLPCRILSCKCLNLALMSLTIPSVVSPLPMQNQSSLPAIHHCSCANSFPSPLRCLPPQLPAYSTSWLLIVTVIGIVSTTKTKCSWMWVLSYHTIQYLTHLYVFVLPCLCEQLDVYLKGKVRTRVGGRVMSTNENGRWFYHWSARFY